ncbi:MAG: YabP/YqfC family sporulation protein [Clostridia bacterium]|nr:YabP/YqfC family sporulation protein [Clostridia bacterium]
MKNRRTISNGKSVIPSLPQIEFYGRNQVSVEEYKGVVIVEYDTETIKLLAGSQKIRFYGSGLNLKNLTKQSVMICGKVTSFEFEE